MKTGEEHYKDYLDNLEQKKMASAGLSLMAAAYSDYAPAMTALAAMYMFGDGVKVNGKKAVELLTRAIELGDGEALFVRGVCSEKAIGVEKDPEAAQNWYKKAAEKGITRSALMA